MTSWQRIVVAAAMVGAWELNSTAQAPTFRSATELVNLNVTVVGADAKPLSGLTQEQFESSNQARDGAYRRIALA